MSLSRSSEILFRKARTAMDRMYSDIQLKRSRFTLRKPLTYRERTILRQLGPYLRSDDLVVYDIGAHNGDYSLTFAKLENVVQVVSFEPIPEIFRDMQARLSGYPHVQCFNVAVGDTPGKMPFHLNVSSSSSSLLSMADLHRELFPSSSQDTEIMVDVVTLDEHVTAHKLPAPDVVKIDVQGFEDRVIQGACNVLQSAQYCIVETSLASLYKGAPTFDQIYTIMRKYEFEVRGVSGETVSPDGRQAQVDIVFARKE